MSQPNLPKARTDAEPQIVSSPRREQLAAAFAQQQTAAEAEQYHALRPRYPQPAVAEMLARSPGPARVVELGAGTGILTHQLLAAGAQVHAVEPSRPMLEILLSRSALPVEGTCASAEDTGLPAGCADIVVAAQAWHWFHPERTQQETVRLLRPGGALAMIWNYLDTADPRVHRLTRIMRAGDVYRPDWQPALNPQLFSTVQSREYRWQRSLTVAEIFGYATTLSSWLTADGAERAKRRRNLEDYLLKELGLSLSSELRIPSITGLHMALLR